MVRRIFFFILVTIFSFTFKAQNYDRVKVGDKCPDFSVVSADGKQNFSNKNLKGKITLINFFATWCQPCMNELPELEKKIWQKYKNNKNFNLLVIGREHSDSQMREFREKKGFTFPVYSDSARKVYDLFAGQYIPRNYIIDKKGNIVFSGINYNEEEFSKLLAKLEELLPVK